MHSGKVIVTGASGFIGRHVVEKLSELNIPTIAIVRDENKAKLLTELRHAEIFKLDVFDGFLSVNQCHESSLIHCAWDGVRNTFSMTHIEEDYAKHYKFIKSAINSGVKKIIVTGSLSEYGLAYGPMSPHRETSPNTPYALAKDMLHRSLRLLQDQIGFEMIWARLFYIHGLHQDKNAILQQLTEAIKRGDQSFKCSPCNQLMDYLSVNEAASQLINLLKAKDGVYNVCSGNPVSLREFLEEKIKEMNSKIKLDMGYYPYRKQDSIAIWGMK